MKKIILAVTGASGARLGFRMLRALKENACEVHLILSRGAIRTIREETSLRTEDFTSLADFVYDEEDTGALIASGTFVTDGMIVAPCSMKTLSGIANAYDENLIIRAADVCLKERRKVVLLPREMPLNNAHLRNMLQASQDGCVILPPMLSFYAGADTVEKQLDQICGKTLMQFGLEYSRFSAWKGSGETADRV